MISIRTYGKETGSDLHIAPSRFRLTEDFKELAAYALSKATATIRCTLFVE